MFGATIKLKQVTALGSAESKWKNLTKKIFRTKAQSLHMHRTFNEVSQTTGGNDKEVKMGEKDKVFTLR